MLLKCKDKKVSPPSCSFTILNWDSFPLSSLSSPVHTHTSFFSLFFFTHFIYTALTHTLALAFWIHYSGKQPTPSNLVLIQHLTLLFASLLVAHPFSGKQQLLNNCSEEEIFNAYVMGSLKHLCPPLKVYPFFLILPCLTEEPSFRHSHAHSHTHIWLFLTGTIYSIHTIKHQLFALPIYLYTILYTHRNTHIQTPHIHPFTYIHRSIVVCNTTLMKWFSG